MDSRIEALTAPNGGYFTRAQAIDGGWLDRELGEARRLGLIRRLGRGLYAPAETYDSLGDEGRHLLLARAMATRQRGQVALIGPSAAALHGLALFGYDLSFAHLIRLDDGVARRRSGIAHHRVGDPIAEFIETKDGTAATSVARTVWELACMGSLESAVVLADSALRLYPDIGPELRELADIFTFRRGSRVARQAVAMADGRAESPGESLSRVGFHRWKVPAPELQAKIYDADGELVARADFLWDHDRHVGEFDGKIKYGRLLRTGESAADAVFREKQREDRVRAEQLGMTRWIWAEVLPGQIPQLIHRLNLDRARSRKIYAHNRVVIA